MQDPKRQTPEQLFLGTNADANPKHFKPFGAPAYVLNANRRDGKPSKKWAPRAKVGIYLGQSPIHNREVGLVLDRFTGYVSPQFHIRLILDSTPAKQEELESRWQISIFFENDKVRNQSIPKKRKFKQSMSNRSEGAEDVNKH